MSAESRTTPTAGRVSRYAVWGTGSEGVLPITPAAIPAFWAPDPPLLSSPLELPTTEVGPSVGADLVAVGFGGYSVAGLDCAAIGSGVESDESEPPINDDDRPSPALVAGFSTWPIIEVGVGLSGEPGALVTLEEVGSWLGLSP